MIDHNTLTANSFASYAEADLWHDIRETASWQSATEASQTKALVTATDYLRAHYVIRAVSVIDPLTSVIVYDPALVEATIILAGIELETPLNRVETTISEESVGLGSLGSITTKFAAVSPSADPYPTITAILSRIARRAGGRRAISVATIY